MRSWRKIRSERGVLFQARATGKTAARRLPAHTRPSTCVIIPRQTAADGLENDPVVGSATCSVISRSTCKGFLGRRVRVSWTLNPVQKRISVYRTTPPSIGIYAQRSVGSCLTIHTERKQRTGMTQGPNAFRIPRRPKEDEDLRHSPRENKDTSNTALATPHEPPWS